MTDNTFLYIILIVYGVFSTLGFVKMYHKENEDLPLPEVPIMVTPAPPELDSVYDLIHNLNDKVATAAKNKEKTVKAIDIFKAITVVRDSDSLVTSINSIIDHAK